MNQQDKNRMEQSWLQMRDILDKEMPVRKQPRTLVPWWMQFGMAAACISVIFVSVGDFIETTQTAVQPVAQVVAAQKFEQASDSLIQSEKSMASIADQNAANQAQDTPNQAVGSDLASRNTYISYFANKKVLPNDRIVSQRATPAQTNDYNKTEAQSIVRPSEFVTNEQKPAQPIISASPEQLPTENSMKPTIGTKTSAIALLPTVAQTQLEIPAPKLTMIQPRNVRGNRLRLGFTTQIGSTLLPLPSSASLAVVTQYRMKDGLHVLAGFGLDKIMNIKNSGEAIAVTPMKIDALGFDPAVRTVLTKQSDSGNYPRLKSAHFWSLFGQVQKNFSTRFVGGAGLKFQTLAEAKLTPTSTFGVQSIANQVDLSALDSAYEELAFSQFAKNSLSAQATLQYLLTKQLGLGVLSQNVLTRNHPESSSFHLTCTYLFK
jgi:hypothetical protein